MPADTHYLTAAIFSGGMHFLCLKELENLLPKIPEDACISLLERVLRNCGCVRGRKAFPCLQDQTTITFLVRMSVKREDIRLYLAPYLEDILTIIIEFIDQARNIDFDFLHSFFTKMLKIKCAVKDILTLLQDISHEDTNSFQYLLYCDVSKYITDELTSESAFSELFSGLVETVRISRLPHLLVKILILLRETNHTSPRTLPSLLLMASSLLQSTKAWDNFQAMTRVEFSDIILNWCFRLVPFYSMESEGRENNLKVLTAVIITLVACSFVNQNPLAVQTAFIVIGLLTGPLDRPIGELEESYRVLPYTLVAVKALVIQIVHANLSPKIQQLLCADNANTPSEASPWSFLTSLMCDFIANSVGSFDIFSSTNDQPRIDQSFYLQSLLFEFPGEFCEVGWDRSNMKLLLDRILESTNLHHCLTNSDEHSNFRLIKFIDLITIIYDGVCIITPLSSTSKQSEEDLSLIVAKYLYPSLVNILSDAHCSPAIIEKVCKLMGKLSARHDREFLSETLDILCCNFSRYYLEASQASASPNSKIDLQQYLLFLSHLGTGLLHLTAVSFFLGGGLDCVPPRIETPSKLRYPILLGIHKALVKLFIGLANDSLAIALDDAMKLRCPVSNCLWSDVAIGLIYLLPSIASTMLLLTPGKENISNSIVTQDDANMITDLGHLVSYDILSLQSLWIHLAIFQFTNLSRWEGKVSEAGLDHFTNFEKIRFAIEQIVAYTPPLVEFRGGTSISYFESEMKANPVAKAILTCDHLGRIHGKYSWVDECTGSDVFEIISRSFECHNITNNIGMILTISALHCLEKLRIEIFGDGRMIFYYLCDEGVVSSTSSTFMITWFAKRAFFDQLKGGLKRPPCLPIQGTQLRQVSTSSMIVFLLTRCIHASGFVRDLAFHYIENIYANNPGLFWEYDSIFTFLRCLDIMGLLLSSAGMQVSTPDYLSSAPWNNDIYLNILPTMEFPGSVAEISDSSRKLLTFGYTFLTQASLHIPELLFPILQEYVLLSSAAIASQFIRPLEIDIGIGVSVANEICTAGRPTFHLNPSTETFVLRHERSIAAAAVSHSFYARAKENNQQFLYRAVQPSSLSIKSQYVGEAIGLLDVVNLHNSEITTDRIFSSSSYKCAFLSIFRSFDEIFSKCVSGSHSHLFIDRCEKLILRGAALLRFKVLANNLYDSSSNKMAESFQHHEISSDATTLFHYFTVSLQKVFSHQLVSCLLFVWKWLLGCSPGHLGSLVLSNIISSFQQTVTMNVGLFHRHHSPCNVSKGDIRPSNAEFFCSSQSPHSNTFFCSSAKTCQTNYSSFEDWIDFMDEIFYAYRSQYLLHLFNFLEILLHDSKLISQESSAMVPRFKLLTFAFRVIKASLVTSQASGSISVHRRRILRERVYEVALDFFTPQNQFTSSNVSVIDKEILVLQEFLTFCFEDFLIWSVDYAEVGSDHVTGRSSSMGVHGGHSRGCGATYSVKYLRALMYSKKLTQDDTDHGCSLKDFGIHLSTSKRLSHFPSLSDLNIVVWVINAFVLQYIDHLIAWRGCRFSLPLTKKKSKAVLTEANLIQLSQKFREVLESPDSMFLRAVKTCWVVSPSLALSFIEKFRCQLSSHQKHFPTLTCLINLITCNPESIRHDWRSIEYLVCISGTSHRPLTAPCFPSLLSDPTLLSFFSKELCHWSLAPVPHVLNLLNRRTVGYFPHSLSSNGFKSELTSHPVVLQYSVRCLRMQIHHHVNTLQFFLPQFVQLLRQDIYGIIADFIGELAVGSTLLCHQLIWLLQLESVDENSETAEQRPLQETRHGYCKSLRGKDSLPMLASEALHKTRSLLTLSQREYLDRECEFFNSITNISAKLKHVKDKEKHNQIIKESLLELGFHPNLYLPTDPFKAVTEVVVDSGIPMQSAAKCPYLLVFHTAPWGGPDSMSTTSANLINTSPKNLRLNTVSIRNSQRLQLSSTPAHAPTPPRKMGIGKMDSRSFHSPKIVNRRVGRDEISHSTSSSEAFDTGDHLSTASSNLEVIPDEAGVRIFRPSNHHFEPLATLQSSGGEVKTDDSTSDVNGLGNKPRGIAWATAPMKPKWMKNWGQWKDFRLSRPQQRKAVPFRATILVGKHTPYPSHTSTASSGKEACIFKVYDDCRQDALTIQVVRMLKDAFEAINLPLYLVPYSVIPNRTGSDHAQGGILQVVANVKSRDQLGKDGAKTLKQHFLNQFGSESSQTYRQAQLEFARSSAGYAIVCYLLSIKDRHNGNILIDNEGHLIHIDFGFLLGISPGGNLGFENAAFKFSAEMIEILGGDKKAEPFRCFVDLTVQGFLVAREIAMTLLVTVTSMMDSGLPCFLHKDNNLDQLRDRFFLELSDGEAAVKMRDLIDDAANKWTTVAYDGIQKLQNNIYSDSWR